MENLTIHTFRVLYNNEPVVFEMKERDYGEFIVHDVFWKDEYLCTISKEGHLLFDNQDNVSHHRKEVDHAFVNWLLDYIRREILPEI